MMLHRSETLKHYVAHLQSAPDEVRALFQDLLINVTDFFRDADVFEDLKIHVFPDIIREVQPGMPIRIWVPGCSTGEEVYSIAISLHEFLGGSANRYPFQIYGTDLSESAIKIARAGVYAESAAKNLTPQRIERYFSVKKGRLQIAKTIRDSCIFSIQDVTNQPPINRLDLLSCRNLMIYLGPAVQNKLMNTFHFALNPKGYLLLGSSETVGSSADLFAIVNKKSKIYQKKSALSARRTELNAPPSKMVSPSPSRNQDTAMPPHPPIRVDPVAEAERLVLEKYAPAWVLVNAELEIVQFKGATGSFIEPASGQPTWNLMRMLREGLAPEVRVLIHTALKHNEPVRKEKLRFAADVGERNIEVEAVPINPSHCLILFIERSSEKISKKSTASLGKGDQTTRTAVDAEVQRIRVELAQTQSSLQSIIEDQNASNEEMQSANEEVLSANEELQSTNEELETAKEELQSTNEELTSLNDELTSRNRELDHLNNDLVNILGNANVSIVMVDLEGRIRRFTPMAEKLLNLIPADQGRKLTDINIGFQLTDLSKQIDEVIRNMMSLEIEVQDRHKCWYSVRIKPYRTIDLRIDGAVLVFVSIEEAKLRERNARETRQFTDGIIQTVRDPLIVLNDALCVDQANQAFYDVFRLKSRETLGRSFFELSGNRWDNPELRKVLEDVLPSQKEVRDFRVDQEFPGIGRKTLILNARALEWEGQIHLLVLISLHDITSHESTRSDG